jgi:hypothetical protein
MCKYVHSRSVHNSKIVKSYAADNHKPGKLKRFCCCPINETDVSVTAWPVHTKGEEKEDQ